MPRMITEGSHIDFLEEVVEDLSIWAVDYIDIVVGTLSPDGRVFGMKKLNEQEQIVMYRTQLRGNPQAWEDWINERVNSIKELISKSGLGEDVIRAVHPYDVVERFAVKFSSRMERLMQEYEGNITTKQSPRPAAPPDDESEDMTDDAADSDTAVS